MKIFKLVFFLQKLPTIQLDFLKARTMDGLDPGCVGVRVEEGAIPDFSTNPEAFAIVPFFHEKGSRVFHCIGIGTFLLLADGTTEKQIDNLINLLRPDIEGWTAGRVCHNQYLVALPATTQAEFAKHWMESCDPAQLSNAAYAQITDTFLRRLKELPANWLSTNHVSVVFEYLCHSVDALFKRYTDIIQSVDNASQMITERPENKPVEISSIKGAVHSFELGTTSVSKGIVEQKNKEAPDAR